MTNLKIILLANLAKFLAYVSQKLGKGSGTALPGLIVERRFMDVLGPIADQFEEIILISGTNGKTTTRAILVDIYEKNGIAVCTNRGGANILRGIASSLLLNLDNKGKITSRVAILEVEEASLPKLVKYVSPDIVILTNIFRDQLDAYGEIDQTIGYFKQALVIAQARKPLKLYINADDHKLLTAAQGFKGQIYGFGLNLPDTKKPDYEDQSTQVATDYIAKFIGYNVRSNSFQVATNDNLIHKLTTLLPGVYNQYNVMAAFLVGYLRFTVMAIQPIADFKPVFGRGEDIILENGKKLQLFLIKNPAGFNQVLSWIKDSNTKKPSLNLAILINDNIADGRDVSWLWDSDLESFITAQPTKYFFTGGTRGADMLLRLEYAGLEAKTNQNLTNYERLLEKINSTGEDFIVLATYTALMDFRKILAIKSNLKQITEKGN
jgi:lipid II isoglutaminyl synthase (glutamine-hydrolysing)